MVCLGLKSGLAGWKAQMNPLSHGGTPNNFSCALKNGETYVARLMETLSPDRRFLIEIRKNFWPIINNHSFDDE